MITEAAIKSAMATVPKINKTIELKDNGERGAGRLVLVIRPFEKAFSTEVRVTAEWYAYSYRGGRRATAKIGSYPALTLALARKEFREKFAPDISAGKALVGIRSRAAKVQREATLRAMFDHYLNHLKGRPSHSNARTVLARAAKKFGPNRLASSLTTAEISEYLGAIHKTGAITSADGMRATLHAAFNHAIKAENDYTKQGPVRTWGLTHNPVSAIPADLASRRVRTRYLTPAEWVMFYKWLETQDEIFAAAPAVRLIMLLGQRHIEVKGLGPAHYDTVEKMLDWEKTKNKRPHCIPLPRQAVEIMRDLVANKHGLYFPGAKRTDKPVNYNTTKRLVNHFLKAHPEVPKFILANARSTWKTLAGAAGISKEMRDTLQNHAKGDVSSKHYDRWSQIPEKRAAMEQWSEYVDFMLSGELDKAGLESGKQPISLGEIRSRRQQAKVA